MQGVYPVITLCGSTRFKDAFYEVQKQLTLAGNIVISVGLFGHSGDEEVWDGMDEGTLSKTKEMLDDMHKRKIDMADSIYVINVDGYIGESTKSEMQYSFKTADDSGRDTSRNFLFMLYAFLRGEEARNDYMSGTLDINYIQMSGEVARFCVGEIGSGMKYTMERASVIREVQAVKNSSLIFKDILPLMGVEFVRYGMLTVMPFLFKYLREYAMKTSD